MDCGAAYFPYEEQQLFRVPFFVGVPVGSGLSVKEPSTNRSRAIVPSPLRTNQKHIDQDLKPNENTQQVVDNNSTVVPKKEPAKDGNDSIDAPTSRAETVVQNQKQ